jgi:hypothetical protein
MKSKPTNDPLTESLARLRRLKARAKEHYKWEDLKARAAANKLERRKSLPTVGCVYYMFDHRVNEVKIGHSIDPIDRLRRFLTSSPYLELIAVEDGGESLERLRQHEFTEYHTRREWFTLGPRLASHIKQLAAINSGTRPTR